MAFHLNPIQTYSFFNTLNAICFFCQFRVTLYKAIFIKHIYNISSFLQQHLDLLNH